MATSAGEVSLDVLGDLSKFRESVTRQLESMRLPDVKLPVLADLTRFKDDLKKFRASKLAAVKLPVSADFTRLRDDIKRFRQSKQAALKLPVSADLVKIRADLKKLAASKLPTLKLKVELDSAEALARIRFLQSLKLNPVTFEVQADTAAAMAELERLRQVAPHEVNIRADVDTAGAHASIAKLGSALTGLRKFAKIGSIAVAGLGTAAAGVFAGVGGGLAVLGGAFLGLGIKIASANAEVKQTFTDLFADIQKQAADLVKPFIGPLKQVAGLISRTFTAIGPSLGRIFSTLAPTLVPIVQGISDMVRALMPVFESLATAVAPMLVNLGSALATLGAQLGQFLTPLIQVLSQVGGNLFGTLLGGIGQLLVSLGPLLAGLVQVGSVLLGPLLGAISQIVGALGQALVPVLRSIAPVFIQLVTTLAPLASQLFAALSPILIGLVPILSQVFLTLAPIISALISGLQPAISSLVPVVGLLVGALSRILLAVMPLLVPLGQLIGQLVGALLPVLTPIINLISQLAAQILGALVQALIQAMPSVVTIVGALASIYPAMLPLIPLLAQLLLAVIPLIPPIAQLAATLITFMVPIIRTWITVLVSVYSTILKLLIPVVQMLVTALTWAVGIIQAVVRAIAPVFTWLYANVVKPAFDGIVTAFHAVAAAASWLWTTVLHPVFNVIGTAAKILLAIIVVAVIGPIVVAVKYVLAPVFRWLYSNVVKPVFSAIGSYIKSVWNGVIKPVWNALKAFVSGVLAPTFRWLYSNVVHPVFNSIGSHIRSVYNGVIKPAFDRLKSALGSVGTAFSRGASAIRSAWSKVASYAKTPINFVIQTVYNKGIVGLWNQVMGWLHLPKSLALHTYPALASGGELSRVQPEKVNRPKAIVGEGNPRYPEYVIPTDPQYRGRASALWAQAGGDMQMLAGGGILGDVLDKVKKGASKVFDIGKAALNFVTNPKAIFDKLADPIRNQAQSLGTSPWGKAAAAIPPKMLDQVWGAAKQLVDAFSSGMGGDANAVVQAAKTQLGVPYVWGGTAWNRGLDCSGLTQGSYWHGAKVHIGRTTYDQIHDGRSVSSRSDLMPGDLVFPHADLSHVMMAATPGAKGDQGMIEAPHTGANVRMASFRGMAGGARRIMENIPAARGGGGTGTAFATYYWDGNVPTASGRHMSSDTIASPTWPLGTRVQMNANGRSVVGTVYDFGPADWVVHRNGNRQMIDLATPLSGKLFGSPNNGTVQFKILSKGTGRSYLGRRPQWGSTLSGFEKGGIAPADSWGVVGEAGPELVRFGKSTQVIDHETSKQLAGGPMIGTVNLQTPEKASVEDVIHELEFALRKAKKGGVYAGV